MAAISCGVQPASARRTEATWRNPWNVRTILDTRTYMLALSEPRQLRAQWQRAAELLLGETDVAVFSKQVELALF